MQMKRPSRKRFHLHGRLSSPQPSNCPHFICLRAIPGGSHRVGGSLGWGWNVRLSLPVILATEQGGWSLARPKPLPQPPGLGTPEVSGVVDGTVPWWP